MPKPIIVCVDDEKIVLDSLKSQLRSYFDRNCVIETAESGEEALELIQELVEEFDTAPQLVISDQIMPKMKGDELLTLVGEKYPDTLKILLTGQAVMEDVINAVNKAGLYRYVSKPWDRTDLNLTVKEAIISYQKSKEIEVQKDQLIELNKGLEQKVKQRTQQLEEQKEELEIEKKKSDELLLNILPKEIADELKEKGHATPKSYELVSVMFADFKDFTLIAEKLTPEKIIKELDEVFQAFDDIAIRNGVERIKTIGDEYMCAGGIPVANKTNPLDVVKTAVEIRDFMILWNAEKAKQKKTPWPVRIGVHSGSVVAGVVGSHKFSYDIWGDAVNLASRMESSGKIGEVNISDATYAYVKGEFDCTSRGKVTAKNKGEIEMYFVK